MPSTPSLLVLTDFFPASGRALDYAVNLAEPLGAKLVLQHVRRNSELDPDALTKGLSGLTPPAVQLALSHLTHHLPVPAVTEVGHGRVLPAVLDAISRHRPALVVLSRPNDEPVPDELASTTALDILQQAPYPLLVVPPTLVRMVVPRRLLLAVDGEPFTLGKHAGMARRVLHALHANLTLLHAAADENLAAHAGALANAGSQIEEELDLSPVSTSVVANESPAAGILAAAQPADYDAVVMLARRRSVLGRLFHRSVTAQVLLHSKVPVLVLPVD
ncbi:MAG TPA: universal stress protein [Hymenobacter sp.]|jgi:nucleotide-binding universal stress UspA family protein